MISLRIYQDILDLSDKIETYIFRGSEVPGGSQLIFRPALLHRSSQSEVNTIGHGMTGKSPAI